MKRKQEKKHGKSELCNLYTQPPSCNAVLYNKLVIGAMAIMSTSRCNILYTLPTRYNSFV